MTNRETMLLAEADELLAAVWHETDDQITANTLDRARQLIREAVKGEPIDL